MLNVVWPAGVPGDKGVQGQKLNQLGWEGKVNILAALKD